MVHECPGCGRSYYCVHNNCGFRLDEPCDTCRAKVKPSTRQAVEDAINASKQGKPWPKD